MRDRTSLWLSQPIPIVLVGNKCDLLGAKEFHEEEAWINAKAKELGLKKGFLISSKEGNFLEDCVQQIVHELTDLEHEVFEVSGSFSNIS